MTSKMGSELRASACLTLEMIFLPIKLRVTAASALQSVRYCFPTYNIEIDSQRQWGYGTCYGDSFPAAKECKLYLGRGTPWYHVTVPWLY